MRKNCFFMIAFVLNVLFIACSDDDPVTVEPPANTNRNLATTQTLFERFQQEDSAIYSLLAQDVAIEVKLAFDGSQQAVRFEGYPASRGYISRVFNNFSQIRFSDFRFTASEDGASVFVQANGDFTVAGSGASYKNVYIYRCQFDEAGMIRFVEEYANPITIGELFRTPMGSCQQVLCN